MAAFAKAAADVTAETIWPTRCAICDAPGSIICEPCMQRLTWVDQCMACPSCGAPYGRVQCTECNAVMLGASGLSQFPLDGMVSALIADEAARRIVRMYKDQGERRLGTTIAQAAARCVPPAWMAEAKAVSFVPNTTASMRRRGFDHARELACLVADELGCDCFGLLERPRSTDQRALSRKERFTNMADAISMCANAPVPSSVILFDDVCTTGATLYAAATALRRSGTQRVFAVTFCRVLD